MSKVEYITKYHVLEVKHKEITYECMVSSDFKNLYECDPKPENWVEIEDLIRDAAWNLDIKNYFD
jgi:hypothetical protein